LNRLLKNVRKSPSLPRGCAAYKAINKAVASEKDVLSHLDIQIFQNLVGKIKEELSGKPEASFYAPLPGRGDVRPSSPPSRQSLLSLRLSREGSLDHITGEGGIPLRLQQCSNKLVRLYYGKMDELIERCHSMENKKTENPDIAVSHDEDAAVVDLTDMKEAIETLIQDRSYELATRFKDNPAGLIAYRMTLSTKAGEYMATKRALAETFQLHVSVYRSEYQDRPEPLRAEREKLYSRTVSPPTSHEETVNNAVIVLKVTAMDKVLETLDEQRAARIAERRNSLYMKFLEPGKLAKHKDELLKKDSAFEGTEECVAIDQAIEMLNSPWPLN
jgi:hypothetical protein